MVEFYRDFDWELDRFVEYRLPIKKTTLVYVNKQVSETD